MLLAVFSFSVGLARADQIEPEQREKVAEVIRARGFVCRTCEGGRIWENVNGGTLLQAYCNRNSLVYRIVLTPAQKVSCVARWDDDAGKCK
jgi:hypothetical protein